MSDHVLTFIVEGPAVGKGRPRVTRTHTYTPEKTKHYGELVKRAAQRAIIDCPDFVVMRCPIHIDIQIRVAPLAKWSDRRRALAIAGHIMPTSKPDKDNVEKSILDACNGVVWDDDSFVCSGTFQKYFAEGACAIVTIRRLPGDIVQDD
jgi:Holliday junction resolvase RusA-like endonuclease